MSISIFLLNVFFFSCIFCTVASFVLFISYFLNFFHKVFYFPGKRSQDRINLLLVFYFPGCQESDATDRRHVVSVTRDADFVVQQLRGAFKSDPCCGWQLDLRSRWFRRLRSDDTRTQDFGARVRARGSS